MDKWQFTDELIQSCRQLSVSAVISSRIEIKYNGSNSLALCPFHNDNKLGSFVITDSKSIWKCFSCGEGGDAIVFLANLEGIDYIEAAYRLGLEFGLITQHDFDNYYGSRRYKKDDVVRIQKRYSELDKKRLESNIAEPAILNKVFRLFINECKLDELHKNHLIHERGLTLGQIEESRYFTFPTRSITRSFVKEVVKEFGNDEVLRTIPGFFWSQEDAKWLFPKYKGIGIPIVNSFGEIVGIQIRRDDSADKEKRYVWFSSSFAMNHEKFEHGTSSGAPIDVVYPDVITNNSVIVTEGRFKAQILAKSTGSVTFSVQGVGSWKGIIKELERLALADKPQFNYIHEDYRPSLVLSAFDADMSKNVQVFEQLKRMTDAIEEKRYPVYYLFWDEKLGKGADDIILNGHKSSIQRYDKSIWDKKFENMIQTICREEGIEEKDVKKVSKDKVLEYFIEEFDDIKPLPANQISAFHKKLLSNID